MPIKTVNLVSSDQQNFELETALAKKSEFVLNFIAEMEDGEEETVTFSVPNVAGETLAKIIEWLKKHQQAEAEKMDEDDLKDWDMDFVREFSNRKLFELIMAANYMNIKELLDLTTQRVADMIRGKTPPELRTLFGIKIEDEFTPEEAEEVKREGLWTW